MNQAGQPRIGVVVIGRNEGERLKACLRSVAGVGPVAYVDSGSTDGSQAFAAALGVEVVELAVPPHFTAARARNAGLAALRRHAPGLVYAQMVDGDCAVQPGWIAAAARALDAEPDLAIVFGRRRERAPGASLYNALCDVEWNVPVGEVAQCGGDVMLRIAAVEEAGLYPAEMIAGEEPDLSARLRARGWRLRRIEGEMTLHDAAMTRFGQWWNRTRRAGHAFAELAARHPGLAAPDYARICRRIVLWGAVLPAIAVAGLLAGVAADPRWLVLPALVAALSLANMARLALRAWRGGLPPRLAAASGTLMMVGKHAEFLGLARFRLNRRRGRRSRLIEYKGPAAA